MCDCRCKCESTRQVITFEGMVLCPEYGSESQEHATGRVHFPVDADQFSDMRTYFSDGAIRNIATHVNYRLTNISA